MNAGYIAQRLLGSALVILGVITLVFLLIHLVPGDPVEVMLGESAAPADRVALRHALGLDQPLPVQWLHYVEGLAHFDLGTSLYAHRPISAVFAERLPATAELAAGAMGVSLLIALPLGVMSARHPDSSWDRGAMAFSTLGISIPGFWLGPMLILLFALRLGWLPVSGRESPASLVLPSLTLGIGMASVLSRMVRAALLDVMREDYLRTARAKGLPEWRVILHHAARNAALPVLTVLGLQLGALLAGTVITETIFQWPGLGQLTVEAIQRRDYPVVQACVLIISVTYVLVNTLTDIAYTLLDPRVRMQ
jgi:peptide/nickel transport system permease protein